MIKEILGEFFCHTLCQRGDKHALLTLASSKYLVCEIVNLIFALSHVNLRIEQSSRPDYLFHYYSLCLSKFKVSWRGRYINHLMGHILKLVERQRTVVKGGRQPESIFHKVAFSCLIATIHGIYLWHCDMALVNHH